MNYNLKFVPLHNYTDFAGVGMAGNLLMVTNELLLLNENDSVRVDMSNIKTICSDDTKNENYWENYILQKQEFQEYINIELKPPRPVRLIYDKYYALDDTIMTESKIAFYKHFSFKEDLLKEVNMFYDENIFNKITLGCQIRLGDMLTHNNIANIKPYWDKLLQILKEKPEIEQIFIATDDEIAINYLKSNSKIPIIYLNNVYRTSSLDPWARLKNDRKKHNYNLCKEVLIDILLLTKCDYFLRAQVSSVSLMSTILAEKIKKIYYI